ncbi:MAG: polysaccharide pyruvyl transferase family protein [Blastomonas fulva]|jgi:hypothetical protein|uniref:polysaccharide pyruvyl transferase family protein n=1 Tax=Blastomonas fulva TaxID=1550728 RepID=UPI0024E25454|nr:polysaccharide pyruvyl transferase family protein [Blastomonas fulva]MDK2757730.1 polysaccharide pyruvyl transferase family protein [Blastomonas fulva]
MDSRYCLLVHPGSNNLGDAIQSLAARRFLPQIDTLVARERMSEPGTLDGPVRVILNGWFMQDPRFWPPHPAMEPLPVSMHFFEPARNPLKRLKASPRHQMLTGAGGEWLRKWGPVGARDFTTLEALEQYDIPAYHSGCLTLTLQQDTPLPRGDAIVACDLPPAALAALRQQAGNRPIITVTHFVPQGIDWAGHQKAALDMLQCYAQASAVVTTRIHAALPCLALKTPVILLTKALSRRRVTDMTQLMHSSRISDFIAKRHAFNFVTPPENPDEFRKLAVTLEKICSDFALHGHAKS